MDRTCTKLRLLLGLLLTAATPALAGGLDVTVLDGGRRRPGGVAGATVTLEGTAHSAPTDVRGAASLTSITPGLYVLRVTGPAGFTPVRRTVEVPSGTLALPPLLLPRIPTGVAVTVPTTAGAADGDVEVESPLVPGARLSIPAGTTITGAGDDPALAIFPVDRSLTPVPFPDGFEPIRLYAISRAGGGFGLPLDVRLPNDEGLTPGTQASIFGLLPRADGEEDWQEVGVATVDAGGTFLASDVACVESATLLALHADTQAILTTYRLRVQDLAGSPVSGAVVSVHGVTLAETGTAGTYEGTDVVHAGAPVRALVTKDLGSGLALHALTDPVRVRLMTLLHDAQPLQLALDASGEAGAGGVVRNATTSHADTLLTEATLVPFAGDGDGGAGSDHVTFAGPLNLTFAGPAAPLLELVHAPAGTSGAPDTAPVLSLTLAVFDPAFDPDAVDPYTTTARVTSASLSLDGGSTWSVATIQSSSDALGPLCALPGDGRLALRWHAHATPLPAGVTGSAQAVRLRVSVLDAPGGDERAVEATFHYRWLSAAPPAIVGVVPPPGATDVLIDTIVRLDFDAAMNAATIDATTVRLLQAGTTPVTTASVSYVATAQQVWIDVAGHLPVNTSFTLQVDEGVASSAGLPLGATFASQFRTGVETRPGDADGDGLLDLEEDVYGTDADDPDSDDDGLSDWEELFVHFTDPTNADSDGDDAEDDADSDPLGTPTSPAAVAPVYSSGSFLVIDIAPFGSGVAVDAPLVLTFNNEVDVSTITSLNVALVLPADEEEEEDSAVPMHLLPQPNPRAIALLPNAPLLPDQPYGLLIHTGVDPIRDTAGTVLSPSLQNYPTLFRTGSFATTQYEVTPYHETLAMTGWERFPLTAPTAGGRSGAAVAVPVTHKLLLAETDVVTPGRGIDVDITRIHRTNEPAAVYSGCFGDQWFCPWERGFAVVASVDTDAVVDLRHRTADGRTFDYQSASGRTDTYPQDYQSPPGFYDALRAVTEGGTTYLVQRQRDGTRHFYAFYRGSSDTPVSPTALQAGDLGLLKKVVDRELRQVFRTPG